MGARHSGKQGLTSLVCPKTPRCELIQVEGNRSRDFSPFRSPIRPSTIDHMTPTATSKSWNDVQDGLERLGLKLHLHLQQATSAERTYAEETLTKFSSAIDTAIRSIKDASNDPAIRSDLHDVASSLSDAISGAMASTGSEVRSALQRLRPDRNS